MPQKKHQVDGTVHELRNKSRLLCYTIHETLSWNNHVSDLCDRIRSNVAFAITMSIDNIFFKQR